VISPEGVETVPLGLFVIKGDNVAVLGEVDTSLDERVHWSSTKGETLKPVVH